MRRILFITAFPPNKLTAGQNYTRLLLNDLANKYDIDLIYWKYPNHTIDIPNNVNILKAYESPKKNLIIRNLRYGFPLFTKRLNHKTIQYLKYIALKYDIIYFDFSQTIIYASRIKHPLKIGMSHDVIAQKFERKKYANLLLPWIKSTEKKYLSSLNHIFTFSSKDSESIYNNYNLKSTPVPFYIEQDILDIQIPKLSVDNYYVMYAAWNRKENQESLSWLFKNRHIFKDDIKIIGGGMPNNLKEMIDKISNISYLGFVDNPYPIIAKSKALIAPLYNGAGVKVKAIESLALGVPILGTDITFEGINLEIDNNINALININDINLITHINQLNSYSSEDHEMIKQAFLQSYSKYKFVDYLNNIITHT